MLVVSRRSGAERTDQLHAKFSIRPYLRVGISQHIPPIAVGLEEILTIDDERYVRNILGVSRTSIPVEGCLFA